jgi:hypothetical protein
MVFKMQMDILEKKYLELKKLYETRLLFLIA